MYWDVTSVKPIEYLSLKVTFKDGLTGTVHFKPSHLYGVFEILKDPNYFNKVYLGNGVVTWPGEIDLAPDSMHDAIKQNGRWILQ